MPTGCPNRTQPVLPQNGPTHRYPLQQSPYHYHANSAHQAAPPPQAVTSSQFFRPPAANTASTSQPFCTFKAPQPSSQERDFLMPVTKLVNAQQAAQRNLTAVTELTAGNPTLETHAQKSYNDETLLREHFVPLPTNIQTPVNTDLLAAELEVYTFPELAEYLISGLREGFHLGYTGPRFAITPKNLKSAWDNAAQVTEATVKELSRDHIAGPFPTPPLENLHCSPLGAVPKNDNTWRLILDLSSPRGQSVNESISKDDFSVKFTKFDDAVDMVSRLVKGTLMAKIYIKHAFRFLPVHPDDWDPLELVGQVYIL